MSFTHSRLTVVIFNLINITAFTNTAEMADEDDLHDVTCFGAVRKAYAAGLGDGTFTLGGVHDNTANGPRAVIKAYKALQATNGPATFVYRPEGTGSGLPQSSVGVLVKSYVDTSAVAAMMMWKATLQMSGTLDETDQA